MKKIILSVILMTVTLTALAQTQVVIWTNQNLHGPIKVYCNDRYVGSITKYYPSAPKPGAAGCVTLTVSGRDNIWYGEALDGSRWSSSKMVLQNGNYYTIRLYDPDPRGSHNGSSYHSYDYYYDPYDYYGDVDDLLSDVGATLVMAAVVGVFVGGAKSTWDAYTERIDLDVYWGSKTGVLGMALSYRTKGVMGITAGLGTGYDDSSLRWNAGLQAWMFNGWNIEAGACSQYYYEIEHVKPSLYFTTNSEIHLFKGVGLYAGVGAAIPFQRELSPKFVGNIGLRFRLSAK